MAEVEVGRPSAFVLSVLGWQVLVLLAATGAMAGFGRGDAAGLWCGGGILAASLVLQRRALLWILRPGRRRWLAIILLVCRLGLPFAAVWIVLEQGLVGPLSLGLGAATLPLAIVGHACYPLGRSVGSS